MNLWLDDERLPPSDEWFWAKTAQEAIDWLEKNADNVSRISLDHDLGPEEAGSGYQVACWLEGNYHKYFNYEDYENPTTLTINLHSANPIGVQKMYQALRKHYSVTNRDRNTYIDVLKKRLETKINSLQKELEEATNSLNKLG